MKRALIDTSAFIASETGRDIRLESMPDEGAVSVVTIAELYAGVLAASNTDTRMKRIDTLRVAESIKPLEINDAVAREWARLRFRLAEVDRRIGVNDLWIAATAVAHDLPLVTQDRGFEVLADLGGPVIIAA